MNTTENNKSQLNTPPSGAGGLNVKIKAKYYEYNRKQ
jgi:hypothetical protein